MLGKTTTCSDLSGVLPSRPVSRNRNRSKHQCGREQQSSACWGIAQAAAISISDLSPCPSPGKCGMIRFSMLMSPDSMGNISFSAFCGAEAAHEDGTKGCPCHTHTPAHGSSPCPAPAPLPLARAGWTPRLYTGRNLPGEHRANGSPVQRMKEIEMVGPRSLFGSRFGLGQLQVEFAALFFPTPLVPAPRRLTWNSYISVNRR